MLGLLPLCFMQKRAESFQCSTRARQSCSVHLLDGVAFRDQQLELVIV